MRNAYDAAMRDVLLDALAVAQADPGVRVVPDGAGPSFCSGGDLDEFGTRRDPASAHLVRLPERRPRPAPVADRHRAGARRAGGVGGGAGRARRRVEAAPDATFALPEVAMGLVPGAGGTVSIPARIGRHRTAWLALTGERIDAPTAREWGLVDEVVEEVTSVT